MGKELAVKIRRALVASANPLLWNLPDRFNRARPAIIPSSERPRGYTNAETAFFTTYPMAVSNSEPR
jgi:hypothetical protein